MMKRYTFRVILFICYCLGTSIPCWGEVIVGTKMTDFGLQALDNQFYGTQEGAGKVLVLFFMGYN